jgi:hypothetical protein
MIHRLVKLLSRFWSPEHGPYPLLILLFITIFVVSPLLSAQVIAPTVFQTVLWLIIVAGAFNVDSRLPLRLIALIVAVLSMALQWIGPLLFGKTNIVEVQILLSIGMLSIFALLMIKSFLVTGRAWEHRIAAAVAVYLLLGLIWARLYEMVALLVPGAFHIPEGESLNPASLVYFSFVTLATLGYGDFTPVHIVARNLAVLEAITGQLYLVILISRLVSEGIANSVEKQRK